MTLLGQEADHRQESHCYISHAACPSNPPRGINDTCISKQIINEVLNVNVAGENIAKKKISSFPIFSINSSKST